MKGKSKKERRPPENPIKARKVPIAFGEYCKPPDATGLISVAQYIISTLNSVLMEDNAGQIDHTNASEQ